MFSLKVEENLIFQALFFVLSSSALYNKIYYLSQDLDLDLLLVLWKFTDTLWSSLYGEHPLLIYLFLKKWSKEVIFSTRILNFRDFQDPERSLAPMND
jgi:hypothetical protein